jgi:hypothetical protein
MLLRCGDAGALIVTHKSVIPSWIAVIQAPWMDISLPSMALDTRFPAGMTSNLYVTMKTGAWER